jgi:hypothetical protein
MKNYAPQMLSVRREAEDAAEDDSRATIEKVPIMHLEVHHCKFEDL